MDGYLRQGIEASQVAWAPGWAQLSVHRLTGKKALSRVLCAHPRPVVVCHGLRTDNLCKPTADMPREAARALRRRVRCGRRRQLLACREGA
jgi:hypothetical protein